MTIRLANGTQVVVRLIKERTNGFWLAKTPNALRIIHISEVKR